MTSTCPFAERPRKEGLVKKRGNAALPLPLLGGGRGGERHARARSRDDGRTEAARVGSLV